MATTFKIGDPVIVSDTASLNHGTYGAVSGTGTVYGYDEVLVEFDRDGTTHKFDASQLTALDQPDGGGRGLGGGGLDMVNAKLIRAQLEALNFAEPPKREYDTCTIWVCQCCMIAEVNGEPCNCADHGTVALATQHPYGYMGKLNERATVGMLFEEHAADCSVHTRVHSDDFECDCETKSFSSWWCDGCGSSLGGERHAFTVWFED